MEKSEPEPTPKNRNIEHRKLPKLALLSIFLRADLHIDLQHFQRFQLWHFYHQRSSDIAPEQLGGRAIRFKNVIDLIIKIIRLKPSLIQGGEPYDFPTQLSLIIATLITSKLLRIPYYFPTFENIPPEEKFSMIKRMGISLSPLILTCVKWLARKYSKNAIVIFALNNGAQKNMMQLGVTESKISRLMYATWGVDIDLFTPVCNGSEPNMGPHGILFVGRLVKEKGVLVLLAAFYEVARLLQDAQLFLIGDGPLKEELRRQIETLGIASSVQILGTILNQSLPPYFRAARITVTPSISTRRWIEQVGMVNIQSMACGTPVISTWSGAIPEFVADGKTGILVPENDPHLLAQAIIRLLTDEHLHQQLSYNARQYAITHYDNRRNVEKVEKLLTQCLCQYEHYR
ncbi:MAG: glycosyltransferase family 4 protein [bacterium]